MTTLRLSTDKLTSAALDAVVVGVHSGGENSGGESQPAELVLTDGARAVDDALGGKLVDTIKRLGADGSSGSVTKFVTFGALTAPVVAVVGLGDRPQDGVIATETLRRAVAEAVRSLAGTAKVGVHLPDSGPGAVRAVAEGALLGGYTFTTYKSNTSGTKEPVRTVSLLTDTADKLTRDEVNRAKIVTTAVRRSRDWVNTPGNDLRPPAFADQIGDLAKKAGLGVEILDEKALRKGGYGGILAVGDGSAAPPRLAILKYKPRGATKHVALIGKGITFDTGGYSIKPVAGMEKMKSDMAGAAAVATTIVAAAALKLKIAITAYLPIAENMVSGAAYRPGDVVTMYGGKRVEIINTDAEGRMLLGDAIVRAGEDNPDYLLETSTLTGGQVVALGTRVSGVIGSDELRARVVEAGDRTGELMWPMPLPEEIRSGMDSPIADLSQTNHSGERAGHMLQGGWFLAEHVPADLDWAHIDIAGPSYHTGSAYGHLTYGGTGIPVRTLIDILEDITTNG